MLDKKNDIRNLAQKFEENKIKKIEKLNLTRDNNYELLDNVVINRNIQKNKSKYKKLDKFEKRGEYIIDTSNK